MINRSPGTVFVTGQLAAKGMAALGIDTAKIRTLPFFTPNLFDGLPQGAVEDFLSRFGVGSDTVVLLAAGRMIDSKGFHIPGGSAVIEPKQADGIMGHGFCRFRPQIGCMKKTSHHRRPRRLCQVCALARSG